MVSSAILIFGWVTFAAAHAGHEQKSLAGPHQSLWYNTLPGDGGTQVIQILCPSSSAKIKLLTRL